MKLSDFNYTLPEALIARFPLKERSASRMLCLDGPSGEISHKQFIDIIDLISDNDLLVFNNNF